MSDLALVRKLTEERDVLAQEIDRLKAGDGDGTSGGMEARVAKLEAHMEHVRADLTALKGVPADLGVLSERVSHLPTKGWMVGAVIAAITVIGGLITFGEKLQSIVS